MDGKLVLVDGHSILNRAFFGIPDLTNSEGLHTNAVYGFLNILFKILDEEQPDYLTVAFDVHAPTFRHKMYDAYKGTRKTDGRGTQTAGTFNERNADCHGRYHCRKKKAMKPMICLVRSQSRVRHRV